MNYEDIVEIFTAIGVPRSRISSKGGENVYIPCPLAEWNHERGTDSSRSMSIKVVDHKPSVVHCWACKYSGTLTSLFKELNRLDNLNCYSDVIRSIKSSEKFVFGEFIRRFRSEEVAEVSKMTNEELDAYEPVTWNRVGKEASVKWDLRIDSEYSRIVIPVRDKDGNLEGAQGRDLTGASPQKYFNYARFRRGSSLLGANIDYTQKEVILVEGPTDAIAVNSATGRHVVSIMGSKITLAQAKLIKGYDEVTLFFDNDSAGLKAANDAISMFGLDCKLKSVVYDVKASDPGSCTPEEIVRLLQHNTFPVVIKQSVV